jgi:uncharacterized damage-inducible protein DinB
MTTPRPLEPEPATDERTTLVQHLDEQRTIMLRKLDGLDRAALATTTARSSLTLAGLCHHLAMVEDWWFSSVFLGNPPAAPWGEVDWDAEPDWEFTTAVELPAGELTRRYRASIARSDAIVAAASLDQLAQRPRANGDVVSLRWILAHMLVETARHNGHADLLREAIDGTTGD